MTDTLTDLFCGAGGSGQGAAHVPGLNPPAAEFLLRAVIASLHSSGHDSGVQHGGAA